LSRRALTSAVGHQPPAIRVLSANFGLTADGCWLRAPGIHRFK
jgi:hypothetical protein